MIWCGGTSISILPYQRLIYNYWIFHVNGQHFCGTQKLYRPFYIRCYCLSHSNSIFEPLQLWTMFVGWLFGAGHAINFNLCFARNDAAKRFYGHTGHRVADEFMGWRLMQTILDCGCGLKPGMVAFLTVWRGNLNMCVIYACLCIFGYPGFI